MASASLSLQGPVQPKLTDMAAPDEQTPLLETNGAAETPKSQRKPSSSDDEESSHGSSDSKDRDDLKSSAGLLGIILVLVLGAFIANADGSIVVATYGTITSEIDRLENGSWLVVTYGLTMCAIQPTVGQHSQLNNKEVSQLRLRRSFYGQCPLAVIAIILVAWRLDEPDSSAPPNEDGLDSKTKLRRIDFLGSMSLALAIVGFLLVLDLGGQKILWTHPFIWIIFAIASVFAILFILIEAFVAREPIFPLRLLVHRDVVTAYLVTALQGAAQFGVPLCFHNSGDE
ncbi:MAG: hypothetical protein LQ342_008134 [Letrouitia transgressa]|nr:MAG: hypothetical protein LQ342_008134 [Letrouitia transgressa]